MIDRIILFTIIGLSGVSQTNADSATVQTFDPASLFNHFNGASSQEAHIAGRGGIAYLTPKSQHLIDNGTISRSTIEGNLNRLTTSMKKKLKSTSEVISECWKGLKDETNGHTDMDLSCFLFKSMTSQSFNPVGGARESIRQIVSQFIGSNTCPDGFEERVQAGIANVKFLQCLTQKNDDLEDVMGQLTPSSGHYAGNWGVHVELGYGVAAGMYYQASTGVGYNFKGSHAITVTRTTCLGGKLDLSAGIGISVSFLPNMHDLLGAAMTVELGVDLIGEAGFDVLLHYAYDNNGFANKFVGFGFAFGIGVGIMPVDVAVSYCNTQLIIQLDGQSNDFALINVAGRDEITGSNLACTEKYLGVHSNGKTCCPQDSLCTPSDYCWVDGRECPRSPANIVRSTGLQLRGKYNREWIFKRTFCPNVQRLQPRAKTLADCTKRFDRKAAIGKQKYMIFKEDVNECWFSNTFSLHSCDWAPSRVSQISYKEIAPQPARDPNENLGPDPSRKDQLGRNTGRGGTPRNEIGSSGGHSQPPLRPGHNPKG